MEEAQACAMLLDLQELCPMYNAPVVVVLTLNFGMVKNLIKMTSNREVAYMKTFHTVDVNNFKVWTIAIRSHLEGRNYTRSTQV